MSEPASRVARLTRTADRHLYCHLPAHPDLRTHVAALAAGWLLSKPGRFEADRAGRLRLCKSIGGDLSTLGRSLGWMLDESRHHGEQAGDIAGKALRGLRTRRLRFDDLLALAARFRSFRHAHIRRNARGRARAPATVLALPGTGTVATRIVSETELSRFGREFGACFGQPGIGDYYARRLRQEGLEFWRIDVGDAPGAPIIALTLDTASGCLHEMQHVAGSISFVKDRDLIIKFLDARGSARQPSQPDGSEADRLADYRLLIDPVPASHRMGSADARLAGADWAFEAAEGVLVARLEDEPDARFGRVAVRSWVLRDPHTIREGAQCSVLWWTGPDSEPEEEDPDEERAVIQAAARRYGCEAGIRTALRDACREDHHLATLCRRAFCRAGSTFHADWFGCDRPEQPA